MSRFVWPRLYTLVFAALAGASCVLLQSSDCPAQTPLGFNNVVVLQSGTGGTGISTVTTLQEFTPGGAPVQTITLPSSGAGTKLTNIGSTSTEGTLSISPDGRWITFGGYDATPGTSSANTNTGIARVAGILNTTTGTFALAPMGLGFRASTAATIRGVATNDGNNLWGIGSSQGLVYGSVVGGTGSFGSISSGIGTAYNYIGVFSGTSTNLYATTTVGSNPRVGTFGPATLPTGTATSFTVVPGLPTSTTMGSGFLFLDMTSSIPGLDTLYVADPSATAQGGIWKYSLGLSGTWTVAGQLTGTTGLTLRGLAGFASGPNVRLFATSASTLYTYWDADAATSSLVGTVANLTSIATADSSVQFRGVAVVPEPTSVGMVSIGGAMLLAMGLRRHVRRRNRAS